MHFYPPVEIRVLSPKMSRFSSPTSCPSHAQAKWKTACKIYAARVTSLRAPQQYTSRDGKIGHVLLHALCGARSVAFLLTTLVKETRPLARAYPVTETHSRPAFA
jgi:hypothetical protein